jgi:mono/diheme cytochrome c family protein
LIELTSKMLVRAVCGMAMMAALGCGGSSDSPTAPSPTTPTLTATFSSIQSRVFATRCYSCHGSTRREQNLDLQNNGHANLVSRASTQQATLLLVAPGNPDQSYLVHKIEGRTTIAGLRMPQLQTALTADEIAVIRQWIQGGALNN